MDIAKFGGESKSVDASTMAAPRGGAELGAGKPQLLFENALSSGTNRNDRHYDVTPDGKSFLMIRSGAAEAPPVEIRVALNWFEELKRSVASKN